jgi:hypothetical protein
MKRAALQQSQRAEEEELEEVAGKPNSQEGLAGTEGSDYEPDATSDADNASVSRIS